jgi:hypothetical protein
MFKDRGHESLRHDRIRHPQWDEAALGLREREEQRWMTSEVVLGLTVKVVLIEGD